MADEVIRFRCSECNSKFRVSARKAGTELDCPTCGAPLTVPSDSGSPSPFERVEHVIPVPAESETYTLSAAVDAGETLDDLEEVSPQKQRSRNAEPPARPSAKRESLWPESDVEKSVKEEPLDELESVEPANPSSVNWRVFGWIAAAEVGVLLVGIALPFFNPWLAIPVLLLYILTGLLLFVASWCMGFFHAIKDENFLSVVLFFLPWYFIRYGIRHWPSTRYSVAALGMGFIWITAPFLISLPIGLVGSLFLPNQPVVADDEVVSPPDTPEVAPEPQQAALPAELPLTPEASEQPENSDAEPPADPIPDKPEEQPNEPAAGAASQPPPIRIGPPSRSRASSFRDRGFGSQRGFGGNSRLPSGQRFSRSTTVRQSPDGKTTTTITENGVTTTTTRPSLSSKPPSFEDVQKTNQLSHKLRTLQDEQGTVIVAEVKGTDHGLCWGGQDGIYTCDSAPGVAAVHAGLVKVDQTAKLKFTIQPPAVDYPSLERHGILSHQWGGGSYNSFKIERAQDDEPLTE